MISVQEARDSIKQVCKPLFPIEISRNRSLGLVLSKKLKAGIDLPGFDQSAMDGYAFRHIDFRSGSSFDVVGEAAAGTNPGIKVRRGQAVRIFTGAPLPQGTDTVVMQEKTERTGNRLLITDPELKKGANVRIRGSQIKKGMIALPSNVVLTPGAIGFLSALGIHHVTCFPHPKISIICSGNELNNGKKPLESGEIYESNSHALVAALRSLHIENVSTSLVKDDLASLIKLLKRSLAESDLILMTGGISVGEYDFSSAAIKKLGIKTVFYKIHQKPGKPLYFGKKGKKLVFALPGNPAAALTCFYEYVVPTIRLLCGYPEGFLTSQMLPIHHDYQKKKGLGLFLKGLSDNGGISILDGQESFMLRSFCRADSIVFIPEEKENIIKGELVEVHKIPGISTL